MVKADDIGEASRVQFVFDDHVLDTDRRELHRGRTAVAVEPQVFDLILHLVENRDRVVSKDDLIASVWRGRIVSESTLASRLNAARRAIGGNGGEQRLIRNLARPPPPLPPPGSREPGFAAGSWSARGASRHRRPALRERQRRAGAGLLLGR